MRSHWTRQAENALKCGVRIPRDALVFPAHVLAIYQKAREIDFRGPASPRLISRQFKKAARRSGLSLPPGVSIHVLRHTHATHLPNKGINPKIVSERLGHAKVSIALNIYAHAIKGMQEQAAEAVETMIGAALADS